MKKSEKIVSGITMITCLTTYLLAKNKGYDTTPFTMIGGFVGAIFGETVISIVQKNKNKKDSEES